MSLSSGTRLGPYQILTLIGVGGMGEVYRGRDIKLGRIVAIKVLPDAVAADAQRIARLDSEARALASLNHPHIATLFGSDEFDGRHFLVMEFVDGATLAERLERRRPVPVEETLGIALQIADALEAAHANGVIHRDLKPANIKVRPDHVVKVLDFGLAKRSTGGDGDRDEEITHAELVTAPGTVVGTVAYMAPEVLRGAAADARSDIFSLGIILFELLTGVQPFAGSSIFEVSARILDPAPPVWPPVSMSPHMRAVVDRAMAKDPDRRYQSIADMRRDLEHLAQSQTASLLPSAASHGVDRASEASGNATVGWRRWLTRAALLTFALAAAVVIGRIVLVPRAKPAKELRHKQLTFAGNVRGVAIAPDGKTIAYTTAEEGARRVLVQDVTGGRSVEIWKGELVVEVQWMRDGTQVVISGILNDKLGVWIVPRLGGPGRLLRDGGAHLAVSPDGRELALAFENIVGFRVAPTDGDQERRDVRLQGFRWTSGLDWGVVSNRIAILAGLDDGTFAIVTTAPDGSDMRRVYSDKALASIRWSPVENALYAIRSRSGAADIIRLADSEAATPEIIATGLPWEPADPYQRQSSLSTDGTRLVFVRAFAYANLWRMTTDGRAPPAAVTTGTSRFGSPRLSPDGRWLLASIGPAEQSPIAKVPIAGGDPVPVATAAVNGKGAAWSPDGQQIAFQSAADGTSRIWLVDANTGNSQPVPDSASPGSIEWMSNDRLMWHTPGEHDYLIRDLRAGTDELLAGDASGWMYSARVAPNSRGIAVWWNRPGDSNDGLWIVEWPSRQQQFLAAGDWYPAGWSADNAFIYAYEYLGNQLVKVSVADRSVHPLGKVSSGTVDGCDASRQGDVVVCTVREIHSDAWMVENIDLVPPR